MNYNNKRFRPLSTSANAETTEQTVFVYKQVGQILTSEYSGGNIVEGHLIGIVAEDGSIDMRYHQINHKGELMTGVCQSKPQLLVNGKLHLHETWQWTSGDLSKGESVLEEIGISMGAEKKTKFLHMIPVLASADVRRDVEWYEEKLGFLNIYDSSRYQEGPLDYAVLSRQEVILHLQFQFPDDMTSTDVKIDVKNIDGVFEEYVLAGIVKKEAMNRSTPWSTDEFGLFDLSGNRITFIEDI